MGKTVAVCVQKFRDKGGKITGYRLMNSSKSAVLGDIAADELKHRISSGSVVVKNLRLTTDGRLVDKPDEGMTVDDFYDGFIRYLNENNVLLIDHFQADNDWLNLNNGVITIKVTEQNDYCGHPNVTYVWGITIEDGNLVLRLTGSDGVVMCAAVDNSDQVREFLQVLLSMVGIITVKDRDNMACVEGMRREYVQAFGAYSCQKDVVNAILRGIHDNRLIDGVAEHILEIYRMGKVLTGLNGNYVFSRLLFCGASLNAKGGSDSSSYVEKGFLNLSESIDVAGRFALADYNRNGVILAVAGLTSRDCVRIGTDDGLEEYGSQSDYDVVVRPGVRVHIGRKLGVYHGVPVYLAGISDDAGKPDCLHQIIDACIGYNRRDLCAWGMGYIATKWGDSMCQVDDSVYNEIKVINRKGGVLEVTSIFTYDYYNSYPFCGEVYGRRVKLDDIASVRQFLSAFLEGSLVG